MATPGSRRHPERLVGAALAVQLVAAVTAAALLQPTPSHGPSVTAAPARAATTRSSGLARERAVRQLLATRAAAVLHKDRQAFLATVDPGAASFLRAQSALYDAMAPVPFASWSYELDPSKQQPRTDALDALRGVWWAPRVTIHYALAGFDPSPTTQVQAPTFVLRDGRWYVGADDDFVRPGEHPAQALWDAGPVVLSRGASCLVLGHPRNSALVRSLTSECDAAVPRATAVWGEVWPQRVVLLVPDSEAELASLVPGSGDLSQIAALATAELVAPAGGDSRPVGDRVIINPATFGSLGPLGRRVVLTHEVTHVASRASTGPQVPTWLVEGLADYVGYLGVPVPVRTSAEELRDDVRRGKVPDRLPLDADFDGSRKDLAQTYEMSWLAVVDMVRHYGQPAVLQVYRQAGADRADGALDRALRSQLHVGLDQLTAEWQAYLRSQLS